MHRCLLDKPWAWTVGLVAYNPNTIGLLGMTARQSMYSYHSLLWNRQTSQKHESLPLFSSDSSHHWCLNVFGTQTNFRSHSVGKTQTFVSPRKTLSSGDILTGG